ncbi:MAG: hypothetical protein AAGK78_15800, partial [Planctomycetota bacterium]
GLARLVIEQLIDRCPTRFVETTARMADVHPMFEQAGMQRLSALGDERPFFWFDHMPHQPLPRPRELRRLLRRERACGALRHRPRRSAGVKT